MRNAYCLAAPSRWEGMPNVLLEAGTMGCPVIGSAVGGIPEVILDGETGLIVPAEDDTALAVAIDRYLADSQLRDRFAKAHAERVRAVFSEDALADNYTNIFNDVLKADVR
jgi:glycosyltransferase involved in cell wall biosynthesis